MRKGTWGYVKDEVKQWYKKHPKVDKKFPILTDGAYIRQQGHTVRLSSPTFYRPEELEEREEWANLPLWKDVSKCLPSADFNILRAHYCYGETAKHIASYYRPVGKQAKRKKASVQWIYQKLRNIKEKLKNLSPDNPHNLQKYVDRLRHIPHKKSTLPPSLYPYRFILTTKQLQSFLWQGEVEQSFSRGLMSYEEEEDFPWATTVHGQKWKHFERMRIHPQDAKYAGTSKIKNLKTTVKIKRSGRDYLREKWTLRESQQHFIDAVLVGADCATQSGLGLSLSIWKRTYYPEGLGGQGEFYHVLYQPKE